jgi:hypothetical protein
LRGFQLRQRGQHPWHMTRDIRPEPGELAGGPSPAGGGRTHLQCRSVAERADPSPAPLVWAINPVVTSDRREREGRLPGDRRAQSYSGLGRRDPSSRVPADSSQHSARGRLANEQYPHSGETVKRSGQGGPRAHKRMVERGPAFCFTSGGDTGRTQWTPRSAIPSLERVRLDGWLGVPRGHRPTPGAVNQRRSPLPTPSVLRTS